MASHRAGRRPGVLGGALGVLGELLLTAGALMLLFLVWQLWWTDVLADREHSDIIAGLEDEWSDLDDEEIAPRQDGEPPVPDTIGDTMVWGTMHVPEFDRDRFPLAEGVSLEEVLNVKGVGHYPETALPGQVGNFSVAGHRNTYGRAFEEIASLDDGDAIVVETAEAFYVYEVTESLIVMPQDVEVIAPAPGQPGTEPTERMLTLTACHPMYSARERYIVHAEFAYWTDRADGIPEALATGLATGTAAEEAGTSDDPEAGPDGEDGGTGLFGLPGSPWATVALAVLALAAVLALLLWVIPSLVRAKRSRAGDDATTTDTTNATPNDTTSHAPSDTTSGTTSATPNDTTSATPNDTMSGTTSGTRDDTREGER